MPVLVRTLAQRRFHRIIHRAQAPVQAGRICMRYVISDAEYGRLAAADRANVTSENATWGDMVAVPTVPRGPLRHDLPPEGLIGAGCVLKILLWFQYAVRALPNTPLVAYADDDTYWGLARVDQTFSLRPHADFLDKEKEFDARVAAMRMPPA